MIQRRLLLALVVIEPAFCADKAAKDIIPFARQLYILFVEELFVLGKVFDVFSFAESIFIMKLPLRFVFCQVNAVFGGKAGKILSLRQ